MRITRIYPLLIVGVALGGIVEFIMLGSPHRPNVWTGDIDLAHFFMTVTGFDTFGALAPAYTIAYELLCYIVFGIAWWLLRPRSLLAIAACLVAIILRARSDSLALLFGLPWLLGVLVWFYGRSAKRFFSRVPISVAWLCVLTVNLALMVWHDTFSFFPVWSSTPATIVSFSLMATAFAGLVLACTSKPIDYVAQPFDTWLGEISYPIYLVHGPVIIFAGYLLNSAELAVGFWLYFAILCTLSILAAWAISFAVERPVMRWRRRPHFVSGSVIGASAETAVPGI